MWSGGKLRRWMVGVGCAGALAVGAAPASAAVSSAPAANYPAGDGPFSVAIGDLNGDGRPDLATANF